MKKIFVFIIFSLVPLVAIWSQNSNASADTLKKHVYYLASDELKGRDTGKEGQRIAAAYISTAFDNYGLKKMPNNSYYHWYNLKKKHSNHLVVKNNDNTLFWPWHFYYASGYNHNDTLNTQIVFAGYGSNAEIEPLNITDKAIAFIAESPQQAYKTIMRISKTYGNRYYFVIFQKNNKSINKAWGIEYQLSSYNLPQYFNKTYSQTIVEDWTLPSDSLNIYYCFANVLQNVFMMNDKGLQKAADKNKNEDYGLLSYIMQPKISCIINYSDTIENIKAENVGGFILGNDTSKTVIVTAHYDHIGEKSGKINYGADDNASGTAALLEIARLMAQNAKNGIKPEANLLFMAFSGEELGLLGSEAFVADSMIDIGKIYLNINMDMIGRWDKRHENNRNFVYLLTIGNKSKQLFKIGKKKLDLPEGFEVSNKPGAKEKMLFRYGSDHYSFIKKDIPASVIFTGLHDDYHTPRDTPEKINFQNLTTITNMVYQYIYKVSESK